MFLIKEKINKACKIYQIKSSKVKLIAVSKTVEERRILEAIEAGCLYFGENYIKEAKEKWPEIKSNNPKVKLHFIGHLQSNKAKEALSLFDVIETLDSEKLAQAIAKEQSKQGKEIECFVQVNIGQEKQKGGIDPLAVKNFINDCRDKYGLNITGLMCIPPAEECPSPYFALLAKIAQENNLPNLSMGMSADFEEAIALNSNHIRLGTAIFGKRV